MEKVGKKRIVTPDDAARILAEDRAGRVQKCTTELQEVLKKWQCSLEASMILRNGSITPQVTVVNNKE